MQVGVGNIVSVRPFLSNDFDFILKLFWHSWLTMASENTQTTTIKAQTTKEGCVKNIAAREGALDGGHRSHSAPLRSAQALGLSLFPTKECDANKQWMMVKCSVLLADCVIAHSGG